LSDAHPRAATEQESVFGRMPVLLGEREYGTAGAHATCFAYAVATWCFLTGSCAADLVGAVQGVVCLIAGSLIGVFLASMSLSLGCQRYGLEQIDFCKPAFGQQGAHVVLVFYLINMLGWSGLILVMFGNGIRNMADALGYHPGGWIVGAGAALGLGLAYLIATRGVHLLNVSNAIVTPALIFLVACMFYLLLRDYGWQAIVAAEPLDPHPNPLVNYLITVELGIANGFSWWGGIGFLARNTRSRRNSVYPEILQLGLATGVVCSVALFSALLVKSDDPTEWMVPIGGLFMGALALGFVAVANVTSTAVSLFASGLALRHIPGLRRRPWWQLMVLTALPCMPFVVWPGELYDLGDAFLAYNGTMYAPLSGILFVDYFFVRRQRLALRSIFDGAPERAYHYTRGFNTWALAAVLLGQATYLSLYNPISGEIHLFTRYVPASIAAFALAAALYGISAALRARRAASQPASMRAPAASPLRVPNI
jgi:NCS1 family nucleobase:cation symporter-1